MLFNALVLFKNDASVDSKPRQVINLTKRHQLTLYVCDLTELAGELVTINFALQIILKGAVIRNCTKQQQ